MGWARILLFLSSFISFSYYKFESDVIVRFYSCSFLEMVLQLYKCDQDALPSVRLELHSSNHQLELVNAVRGER